MNIRIITGKTKGLLNDAMVLKESSLKFFSNHHIVRTLPYQASLYEKVVAKTLKLLAAKRLPSSKVTFFVEFTAPRWIHKNTLNVFIPNQEWYYECYDESLKYCDYILCKTKVAEAKFKAIHHSAYYVGFTSPDKYKPEYDAIKDYRKFLHVRGQSAYKGTLELLKLWKEHPEWPELLVISRNSPEINSFRSSNINIRDEFVTDEELTIIQNSYGVHLCPSSVEGFGHYISEALSCKSIILTTNAAPMNELVDEECGFLVDYDHEEMLNFGTAYRVSKASLEAKITSILSVPVKELKRKGEQARLRYSAMKSLFHNNMDNFFKEIAQAEVETLIKDRVTDIEPS